jgi:prevent-host-death family protein
MDVGIRELKQHLSSYLERAARGESIRVTDRGVPKAILGPVPGAVRLDEGIANGWIAPPASRAPAARLRRARARVRTEDALAEDRGE